MLKESTFEFLNDLRKNNYREWFQANRDRYESAKSDVLKLSEMLIYAINDFDPSLGIIDPKKTMFRINRDIRFSHDKRPYKENMGIVFHRGGGRHGEDACYYVHVEPGACFLAGGIYMPSAPVLKSLRTFINDECKDFESIITDKNFVEKWGGLDTNVKKLKKVPAGFSADSPAAEYLKLTAYEVMRRVPDDMLKDEKGFGEILDIFRAAVPLNGFLNGIVDNM